jgi:hypothetical protein
MSVRLAILLALALTNTVIANLHVTLYARYNRAADDNDFFDTSFRQAGVTLRSPF